MDTEKDNSNTWGGSRPGAGRKRGEGSKRVSVPLGCLEEVLRIIAEHNGVSESLSEHVRVAPAAIVSERDSEQSPRFGNTGNTGGTSDIDSDLMQGYEDPMVRRRSLNHAKGRMKKKILVVYGSMHNAAKEGVYLSDDGVLKKVYLSK